MNSIERFAEEAVAFREWAARGTDTGAVAVRNALLRITRLYLAALDLPPAGCDELECDPDADPAPVNPDELRVVREAARRLPLQCYGELFDPLPMPPEEDPVVGDLADDIEDIYSDVVRGLMAFEAGQRAQAVWEWVFCLRFHWGEHATGAIRALHCWLAENAPEQLTSGE